MTKNRIEKHIEALAKALTQDLVNYRLDTGDIHVSWEDMLPNGGESLARQIQRAVEGMLEEVEASELKSRQNKAKLFPNDPKHAKKETKANEIGALAIATSKKMEDFQRENTSEINGEWKTKKAEKQYVAMEKKLAKLDAELDRYL
jgi:hypothetical protein